MNKLEELREYLNQEIGDTVTVIYDRAIGPYKNRDRIRVKRDGCWVCSIYDTKASIFNVIFYNPFICRSVTGLSSVVNLTIEEIPKAIKNRITICDGICDNKIDDDTIAKEIYMMTARGSGKTRWVSDLLKNAWSFKDHIKDVIFNDPATIVFWVDGSKTVVKCQKGETFDPEKGLAMAISKKVLGNDYGYYETFAKHVGRYNKREVRKMIPDYYNTIVINDINDIATKMRVLANHIGGDHLTNKEAEAELHKLAGALSILNMHVNTLANDAVRAIMQTTGSDMIER